MYFIIWTCSFSMEVGLNNNIYLCLGSWLFHYSNIPSIDLCFVQASVYFVFFIKTINPSKDIINLLVYNILLFFPLVPRLPVKHSSGLLSSHTNQNDELNRVFTSVQYVGLGSKKSNVKQKGHRFISQREIQISSCLLSRQKAKPKIRECICIYLRESCLCK